MYQQLQNYKKDFITFLKVEKNLSDHTLRAYESDLKQFFNFWDHLRNKIKIIYHRAKLLNVIW